MATIENEKDETVAIIELGEHGPIRLIRVDSTGCTLDGLRVSEKYVTQLVRALNVRWQIGSDGDD